jgi:pimeloyl-ACP methyl ester carboxylesterase
MQSISRTAIAETDDLQILFDPGTSDTAIVSFTGVGLGLGAMQKIEFGRSLHAAPGDRHHVFYVTDRARSWYNRTRDDILEHLHPRLSHYKKVVTLGNSMGGFGALYFSGLLPNCRRAVSFAPQFSVMPDAPERRWRQWRENIVEWPVRHALENMSEHAPAIVLCGSAGGHDGWQIQQFQKQLRPPHVIFALPVNGHGVALAIRSLGILPQLLEAAIEGVSPAGLERMLRHAGLTLI